MKQTLAVGGNMLVVTGAETEKGAEFVVSSAEPIGGTKFLEAPHTSDPTFQAAMILLKPVIFIGAGPMPNMPSQRGADRAWVGAVPVRGDPVGYHAGGRLGGAEERLGRCHVPVLAEHGVDQIAVAVDGTVDIAPAAPDFQVGFVHVPGASSGAALPPTTLPEFCDQDRREFRFPFADGLVTEDDAALQEHLAEVQKREAVAQAPEHHECNDSGAGSGSAVRHYAR